MKRHNLLFRFLIASTIFLMFSCKKGDTGPAGANGANGSNGLNGNANVRTDTFSVQTADWKYNSIYWVGTSPNVSQGQISKYFDRANPAITDSILSLGAVLVYYTNPGSLQGAWTPLPIAWLDNFTGNFTYNYAFIVSSGKIQMHFFFAKVAGETPPAIATFNVPAIRVKVVCISGKLGLNSAQIKKLQAMPYQQAMQELHVENY